MRLKIFFLLLSILVFGSIDHAGEPQAELNAAIDPHGKPKSVGPGKVTEFGVWFADDAWHIRAAAVAGSRAYFHGKVTVDGGKIDDGSFAGLELGHPKRQGADWVFVEPDKKSFEFLFRTLGHMDGLNFKTTDGAKNVKFSLLVETDTSPANVVIGAAEEHPATNPFILSAHPSKEHAKAKGKKKKSDE
jgi:hypothetical protein